MMKIESIESRGYKQAVKSLKNKYPKLKKVDVFWIKNGVEIYGTKSFQWVGRKNWRDNDSR